MTWHLNNCINSYPLSSQILLEAPVSYWSCDKWGFIVVTCTLCNRLMFDDIRSGSSVLNTLLIKVAYTNK